VYATSNVLGPPAQVRPEPEMSELTSKSRLGVCVTLNSLEERSMQMDLRAGTQCSGRGRLSATKRTAAYISYCRLVA